MGNLVDSQKLLDLVFEVFHNEMKNLMGVHCKRIELLKRQGKFDPELYKDLSKELIWEHFRATIRRIEASTLPSITFIKNKE